MVQLREPNGKAVTYFVVTWKSGHRSVEGPYKRSVAWSVASAFRAQGMNPEIWKDPNRTLTATAPVS